MGINGRHSQWRALSHGDLTGVSPYHLLYFAMNIMRLSIRDLLGIAFKLSQMSIYIMVSNKFWLSCNQYQFIFGNGANEKDTFSG